jgi:soluble lytic murein transglycosylase-like protein
LQYILKIALLVVCAYPAFAGEYAILSSGLRIRADRHELSGETVRLFTNNGVTELPASVIASFEAEDWVEPPAPPAPPPAPAPAPKQKPPADPKALIRDAAARHGLPSNFVASVAAVESAYRQDAISPKGATGVMQLMPDTAKKLDADPTDLEQNIDAGTRLLRELLNKYDGDVAKALAAYNAGPGAVEKYQGVPPYRETQNYVNRVIEKYRQSGGR